MLKYITPWQETFKIDHADPSTKQEKKSLNTLRPKSPPRSIAARGHRGHAVGANINHWNNETMTQHTLPRQQHSEKTNVNINGIEKRLNKLDELFNNVQSNIKATSDKITFIQNEIESMSKVREDAKTSEYVVDQTKSHHDKIVLKIQQLESKT